MNPSSWFAELGFFDCLDILVMSILLYAVLVWFKKTRAAFVVTGILISAGIYFIARQFNLVLTASVFQGFFAVILVAVLIIFQEELRHFFERVAVWGLSPRFGKKKVLRMDRESVAALVRTLTDLAKERIGALIIIRGQDMIMRHLEGGFELNGNLSEALLKSLFDPHSAGHDGAVVIEEDRISRFACYLPLSKNFKKLGEGGTRHAAAMGISELTDCLCLVVSEERGSISFARHGEMEIIDGSEELSHLLDKFYQEIHPRKEPNRWQDFFKKNFKEKGMAFLLALGLWFLTVYGSKLIYHTYTIPVSYTELPEGFVISSIEPSEVSVTFSGPRRSFYFFNTKSIHLGLRLWQIQEGARTIRISPSDMVVPKNMIVENIDPNRIKVNIAGEKPEP